MLLLTVTIIAGTTPTILTISAGPAAITIAPTTATTAAAVNTITVTTGTIIQGPAKSITAITITDLTGPILPETIIHPAMVDVRTSAATAMTRARIPAAHPVAPGPEEHIPPAIHLAVIPEAIPAAVAAHVPDAVTQTRVTPLVQ